MLCFPQNSSTTETSSSDCFVFYQRQSLVGVLLHSRETVGVFYSSSPLGNISREWERERERERESKHILFHYLPVFSSWSLSSFSFSLSFSLDCGFWMSSSSSSCHAISTDTPDRISPHLSIVLCFRQILRATSRIGTELLYVGSNRASNLCSSMCRGLQDYIIYQLVPTSPAVSRVSGSSNFDSFRDRW